MKFIYPAYIRKSLSQNQNISEFVYDDYDKTLEAEQVYGFAGTL